MTTAAAFWLRLEAEEAARKAQVAAVRIRATGNHLVAAQDEPEPESPSMRAIREAGQADAQAVMRGKQP